MNDPKAPETNHSSDRSPEDSSLDKHEAAEDVASKLLQHMEELENKELLAWHVRPRLHTGVFEELDSIQRKKKSADFKTFPPETKRFLNNLHRRTKRRAGRDVKALKWTPEQFNRFQELALAYRHAPSIESYVAIRRSFPEIDIQIAHSGGLEALFILNDDLKAQGVPSDLVAGAMDGFEPDIDYLSVMLIEKIAERDNIRGSGSYQLKAQKISGALVNFIIALVLDGIDWRGRDVRLPASFILLMRHQLGALWGEYHEKYKTREMMRRVAWIVGQQLQAGEPLSINRLIDLAKTADISVSRTTAARWLKDPAFLEHLNFSQNFEKKRLFRPQPR